MAHLNIKKDKVIKDVGGTKPFGVDLDPSGDLCLNKEGERGAKAYYKGKPMKYLDYYAELCERTAKNKKGKTLENIGLFAGVKFDKKGNIIKS